MTAPARTALDIARHRGFAAGLVIADAAFVESGIPLPECNVWLIGSGRGGIRPDFLWRLHRLVGEVDGFTKYTDPLWRPNERVLLEEKKRQMRIEEAGYVVVRWSPAEALYNPTAVLDRVVRHSMMAAQMYGVPPIAFP